MLNNSGKSGHSCLVPDVRGNTFGFLPLRMMFAMGLLWVAFFYIEIGSLYAHFLKSFYHVILHCTFISFINFRKFIFTLFFIFYWGVINICCFCLVAKLCLTLCSPVNCSPPDFPVLHCLPEFAQNHVHWLRNAIQPSHPLFLSGKESTCNAGDAGLILDWKDPLEKEMAIHFA